MRARRARVQDARSLISVIRPEPAQALQMMRLPRSRIRPVPQQRSHVCCTTGAGRLLCAENRLPNSTWIILMLYALLRTGRRYRRRLNAAPGDCVKSDGSGARRSPLSSRPDLIRPSMREAGDNGLAVRRRQVAPYVPCDCFRAASCRIAIMRSITLSIGVPCGNSIFCSGSSTQYPLGCTRWPTIW